MRTDRIRTICRSVVTVVFLSGAAASVAPLSATAARIDVSNCQATTVTLCSFDTKNDPGGATNTHELAQNEQGRFTCHDNCSFRIIDCSTYSACDKCKSDGLWLDDSYGRGTYNLVGLTLNQKGDAYASGNFVETESTEICQ